MSTIAMLSEQGLRSGQEDRSLAKKFTVSGRDAWLLAVFDGHGGDRTAEYCRIKLVDYLTSSNAEDMTTALRTAIKRLAQETCGNQPGTTLSTVCIANDVATAAVIGDSPIIMEDVLGNVWHSPKHNVGSNEVELEAAIARGAFHSNGYISRFRGGEGLQLSRALGDASLRPILSAVPEVYVMSKPFFVLVASDGIAASSGDDEGALDEVTEIAKNATRANYGCRRILEWRKERARLHDNATVVLWKR